MPFVADEIVTAAKLNMATSIAAASNTSDRTFTNTSALDLDALTGGAGTMTAVAVTVTTGTLAIVTLSAIASNTAGVVFLSYRVSGATTIAASGPIGCRREDAASQEVTSAFAHVVTLTAGVNVFELQASVTAGTGRLLSPALVVEGIIV